MQALYTRPNTDMTGNRTAMTGSPKPILTRNLSSQEMLTPPTTPSQAKTSDQFPTRQRSSSTKDYNFSPDLSQAQLLGDGVWSKVYRITSIPTSSPPPSPLNLRIPPSPPQTPQKTTFGKQSSSIAYAVKTATRSDAVPVFRAEAKILTHLQRNHSSADFVVPFLGTCTSNSLQALLFECADLGTLGSLTQSTNSHSLSQILDSFLSILSQLVSGLAFLHASNVVHADIKPANILLSSTESLHPQCRFADFSTAFLVHEGSNSSLAGGTWTYMSPEQLSRDPSLSSPTFSSDVYSLGIVLLTFLSGQSPFSEFESNAFRLREAVKMGYPEDWARRDFKVEQRLGDLEGVWRQRGGEGTVLELIRGAVAKKREDRWTAEGWKRTVDTRIGRLTRRQSVGLGIKC